jgi:hypothetical protein
LRNNVNSFDDLRALEILQVLNVLFLAILKKIVPPQQLA